MKHYRKTRKGGGYGFGGSILSDAGGSNAGNAQWNSDTSQDCAIDSNRGGNGAFAGGKRKRRKTRKGGAVSNDSLMSRGGNNTVGGRRRRHKTRKGGSITAELGNRGGNGGRRRTKKHGGAYVDLAVQAPRTGFSFNGEGVAGTANTIRY
jgi:hypothetical protein